MRSLTLTASVLSPGIALLASGLAIPLPQPGSTLTTRQSCALPSSYQWTDLGGALAEPDNGWLSLKDFTVSSVNGQYIIYGSEYDGSNYGSFGKQKHDPIATADESNFGACVQPSPLSAISASSEVHLRTP